jgi:hypothetical protein
MSLQLEYSPWFEVFLFINRVEYGQTGAKGRYLAWKKDSPYFSSNMYFRDPIQ